MFTMILADYTRSLFLVAAGNTSVEDVATAYVAARTKLLTLLACTDPGLRLSGAVFAVARHEALLTRFADVDRYRGRFFGIAVSSSTARGFVVSIFTIFFGLWTIARSFGRGSRRVELVPEELLHGPVFPPAGGRQPVLPIKVVQVHFVAFLGPHRPHRVRFPAGGQPVQASELLKHPSAMASPGQGAERAAEERHQARDAGLDGDQRRGLVPHGPFCVRLALAE
ncbi:hypothetical protein DFJ74DRAFT_648269 [Hyaloraphidium curvatum]|nr:hypothetical protein DFJ74DRAFT_648269 [Hyaloraphidium curvatum]